LPATTTPLEDGLIRMSAGLPGSTWMTLATFTSQAIYGNNPKKAVYWSYDGASPPVEILLEGTDTAEATDISVSSTGTVYVSGYYTSESETVVAYWVGGAAGVVDLTTNNGSRANGIYYDGSNVRVTGLYFTGSEVTTSYWTNGGTPVRLNTSFGQGQDVRVDSRDVYVAGDYNPGLGRRAAYCAPTVRTRWTGWENRAAAPMDSGLRSTEGWPMLREPRRSVAMKRQSAGRTATW